MKCRTMLSLSIAHWHFSALFTAKHKTQNRERINVSACKIPTSGAAAGAAFFGYL